MVLTGVLSLFVVYSPAILWKLFLLYFGRLGIGSLLGKLPLKIGFMLGKHLHQIQVYGFASEDNEP